MAKTKAKKQLKEKASRKAIAKREASVTAPVQITARATRSTGSTLNGEFVGRKLKQFFEKGKEGTSSAGWYEGVVIDALPGGNLRKASNGDGGVCDDGGGGGWDG